MNEYNNEHKATHLVFVSHSVGNFLLKVLHGHNFPREQRHKFSREGLINLVQPELVNGNTSTRTVNVKTLRITLKHSKFYIFFFLHSKFLFHFFYIY